MLLRFLNLIFTPCIVFTLIFSPVAMGDDSNPEAVPIEEGDPAPFSGTLLTNEAAATLLSEIKTCSERTDSDLQFELDRTRAVCELDQELLQIRLDSQVLRYESIVQSQDEQLDYLLRTNTDRRLSREAVFIIGVGSGVLVTIAAAYGLSSATGGN